MIVCVRKVNYVAAIDAIRDTFALSMFSCPRVSLSYAIIIGPAINEWSLLMTEAACFDQSAMQGSCWTVGEDACWSLNEGDWGVIVGKNIATGKAFLLFWLLVCCSVPPLT